MLAVTALSLSLAMLPNDLANDVRAMLSEQGRNVKSVVCSATGTCRVELDTGTVNLKCDDAGCVVLTVGTAT